MVTLCRRSHCPHQRDKTCNECQRCHLNRSETELSSTCHSFTNTSTHFPLSHSKLHNQDSVFCQKTYQHNQTDAFVYFNSESCYIHCSVHTDAPYRNAEN